MGSGVPDRFHVPMLLVVLFYGTFSAECCFLKEPFVFDYCKSLFLHSVVAGGIAFPERTFGERRHASQLSYVRENA